MNLHDRFIVVNVAGQQRVVDMSLIEPYLKIISHGGIHTESLRRSFYLVPSSLLTMNSFTDIFDGMKYLWK